MLDAFFESICRVGIFMICAQAVVHFRPRESYEKYFKLIVGVMVLLQLFLPIGSVFLPGGRTDMAEELAKLTQAMEKGRRLAEEKAAETEAMLEQMTLEEVQRRIEEQARQQNAETALSGESVQQGEKAVEAESVWQALEKPENGERSPESIQVEQIPEITVGGES